MKTLKSLKTIAAAALVAGAGLWGGGADAATLTFDTWVDTDPPSSTPVVTITEAGLNTFTVNLSKSAGATVVGSVITMYFDVKPVDTMGISASSFLLSPNDAFQTAPTKVAPGSVPANSNLNGTAFPNAADWSFAILFDKKDNIGAEHSVSFTLSSTNALALSDFTKIGLRAQRVGSPSDDPDDRKGSDKLIGTPAVVPLPAAGLLLIGALGGLGLVGRRRRKAA